MHEKTTRSKTLYQGQVVTLRLDTVTAPDGKESTREIVVRSDCVAIVPVDEKGNILLVRQYRHAIQKELLEIPAGSIEPGEKVEDAVRREMQEETGFLPQKLVKLGGFYASPGYCTEYLYLYLVTDLVPSRLFAEDTDEISLVRTPVKEIPALLASGQICDSKSVAGLYLYLNHCSVSEIT
ncbi:MAG: NUDIX hydrolase [Dehalococcoidia bacterium]|nr:NUDIX hydrolase [Dehalococcoidia bacterium]